MMPAESGLTIRRRGGSTRNRTVWTRAITPGIAQTRDGTIWTVSDNNRKGVNRFDGKTWARFRLQDLGGYDHSTSILETGDGTLWVGGKFALHALRDGKWRVYRSGEVPVSSHRVRLLEASDGALWMAGLGQEAVRLDYGTDRWTSYKGLYFQCETPDGSQWFVARDTSGMRSIVRYTASAGSGQGRREVDALWRGGRADGFPSQAHRNPAGHAVGCGESPEHSGYGPVQREGVVFKGAFPAFLVNQCEGGLRVFGRRTLVRGGYSLE